MTQADYPMNVRPLTAEEGGGYLVEFPDLPGCMSDGDTVAEALANAADAQATWLAAMCEAGRMIPAPSADRRELRW
jgi:antitoxin HicB